jgi:hypothetical protein
MVTAHTGHRVDTELLESLVHAHFGRDYTCRLAWDVQRNRYLSSDEPRRLAVPQRLLGLRIWWKTVGEFSYNLGFRLEVWDPTHVPAAQALAEEYNRKVEGEKLSVHAYRRPWPASA